MVKRNLVNVVAFFTSPCQPNTTYMCVKVFTVSLQFLFLKNDNKKHFP